MKRPVFSFLKTAPSSLKTAFGIVKTGLHDFGDGYWYAENHHQRAGSSFSFLSLFPFYFSKLSFYFYTFLLFPWWSSRAVMEWRPAGPQPAWGKQK